MEINCYAFFIISYTGNYYMFPGSKGMSMNEKSSANPCADLQKRYPEKYSRS